MRQMRKVFARKKQPRLEDGFDVDLELDLSSKSMLLFVWLWI